MIFNDIQFPDLKHLSFINQLIDDKEGSKIMVLIQIDDCIDFYMIKDLKQSTIKDLAYYLYIAYDIRSFTDSNIKFIDLSNDQGSDQSLHIMNSYISLLAYDDLMKDQDPSLRS